MPKRVPVKLQVTCCQTLGVLLQSGFRLDDALQFIMVQLPQMKLTLTRMRADLANGVAVEATFERGGFAPVICTQVGLADSHGNLEGALNEVSGYLSLRQEARTRMWQLLAYPLTLVILLTVMQMGIIYWVLPQLQAGTNGALDRQPIIIGGCLCTILLVMLFLKGQTTQKRYALLRHVPIVGRLMTTYYQYEFMIGAASFLAVGRDLGAYCAYLVQTPAGPLATVGVSVTNQLLAGVPLQTALVNPLVPTGLIHLMSLGQEPALFAQSVNTFASTLFKGLQVRMNQLLAFVQPVMFMVIGVQIVLMYARLLLPLYSVVGGY